MPLFTYIVTYNNSSFIAQGSHSNFKGFAMTWINSIPENGISSLTPVLRKELLHKAYAGDFMRITNMQNTWQKAIDLKGKELKVYVIQTER